MGKTLSVVIVSWNSAIPLQACLTSLDQLHIDGLETIVVDSHSQSGTVKLLKELEDSPLARRISLRVLYLDRNIGWAKGVNEAVRIAVGNWILLCNPDIAFNASFHEMIQYASSHDFLVLAAQLVTPKGHLQRCLRRITFTRLFFGFTTLGEFLDAGISRRFVWRDLHYGSVRFGKPTIVDHPSASFFMVRRELLAELEYFISEDFPLYFGDSDLFRRLQDRHIQILLLPSVRIVHEIGYSRKLVPDEVYQFRRFQSLMRYARKWRTHPNLLTVLLFFDALLAPFLKYGGVIKAPQRGDLRASAFRLKGILNA